MEIKGIDVSAYQGNIDWETVADYGMGFAIMRITEKGNKTDSTFEQNYKGCTQHGIPVGVYKYSYAKSPAQAEQEAEVVLKVLNKRKLDFPVFYDLEWSEQRKLGSAAVEKIALAFLNKIQAAGYKVGIYCNVDWYQNVLTAALKKYDCWIARYPANDNGTLQERLRPEVGVGWQYSSKATIPGIGTKVDRNVFYKNYTEGEEKPMSKIEKAVQQMEAWAKDNSHGYDQIYRWGEKGDYDCSAAVIQACQNAGIPVKTGGATYTGNMLKVFTKNGFEIVTHEVNLKTGAGLIRGDVLLNTSHHTAMYCGNGKEVEASINEKGTATGGKPGDQTGREFLIRSYRNYPWTHVLRYTKDDTTNTTTGNTDTTTDTPTGGHYMFEPKTVKKGDSGLSVLLLQEILIARGFKGKDGKPLTLDRTAGTNTIHALTKYQESRKGVLEADGICGDKTWRDLIAL